AHYLQSPYIKEICVLGIEGRPGDPTSERLHAVIVPDFDALRARKIVNAKEVIRFDIEGLSAQIASTKRISSYEIWQEDLPRTTTRKIKRFEVAKRVRAGQNHQDKDAGPSAQNPLTAEETDWLASPQVQRAIGIILEFARNKPEALRPNNNLELDLGLDSMQRVELLVALEQELGGDVEESQLGGIYTVRELVDAVLQNAARQEAPRTQSAGWDAILKEEPSSSPDVLALAEPRPFAERFWFLASRIAGIFFRVAFRLKVDGLEKVPAQGPFILSSNHQSYLDPVALISILPWRHFRNSFAVGTSEIFGSGFMRHLARWLRVVVLDPDANLVPAMRAGAFGLRHGRVLVLYPEGERTIDGAPKTFKKGAAILAIHTQVPIVPVAIDGFFDAWPRGKSFQRLSRFKIRFADPILPPREFSSTETEYENLTSELKAKIVEMWQEFQNGKPAK
ncbi:MAG TPA: 1-acyl-sn-glycerol-3-phosphate acyltransferase, partial [Candidatus Angelobacter sp.]|nr:1-acyl-sn-glycerol-3-phosphate acyltransferase [Candidatus Angelobacter sp.]